MEGVLVETVRLLKTLDPSKAIQVLRNEGKHMEVTKTLLNILFNICFTKAIVLSQRLRKAFRVFDRLVIDLLTGARRAVNKTEGLREKRKVLLRNPELVTLIAKACPTNIKLSGQ